MKIINYKRYMYPLFDCSIHGRILITDQEFKTLRYWVENMPLEYGSNSNIMRACQDIEEGMAKSPNYNLFNIRVTPTEWVVDHMPHTGKLKRGNYYFEIITRGAK